MKIARPITMGCALICAVVLVGCAATPEPPQPEVVAINATSASARVERVDQKQRQLTLKLQDGRRIELAVSPEVRNFAQIAVVTPSRCATSNRAAAEFTRRARPRRLGAGEYVQGAPAARSRPGRCKEGQHRREDRRDCRRSQHRDAAGPRGRKVDAAVREPRRLDGVKVGDLVELTYRQGVAIEVSAPARK